MILLKYSTESLIKSDSDSWILIHSMAKNACKNSIKYEHRLDNHIGPDEIIFRRLFTGNWPLVIKLDIYHFISYIDNMMNIIKKNEQIIDYYDVYSFIHTNLKPSDES